MKKKLKTSIWLFVALLALVFLVFTTDAETFKGAISQINWSWAFWAILVYFISQALLATRWKLLLTVHKIHISLFQAVKLTFLGLFYNNMMPGAVGGDLLKGWFITHHSDKHLKVEAAVTVFVDRLVGLIGMILVAAIASLFVGSQMAYGKFQVRWLVWAIFLALVLGSIIFLSRHVRRGLMLNKLLEMLPFAQTLKKIDQSIRIYRKHIKIMFISLVMTVLIQGMAIVAIWMMTQSLNFHKVTFIQCLIIMPIIWVISSAIPVPGGIGIIENCVKYLFCLVINPDSPVDAAGQAVALALLIRITICFTSLPGALVPIFGGHLPKASELNLQSAERET